jgi:HEAT repeat protein
MNGAIEGMLAVLEDPRSEQAEAAVAGIVDRYHAQGPEALRPFKLRFRKMLSDRDLGVRRVAAWALAHTGDLDVVPALIDAMIVGDEDDEVITSIRLGLQLLSRKVKGFGPPTPSTPDQRIEAARQWREWYQAIRPLDLEGQDEDPVAPAPPGESGAPTSPSGSSPQ